MRAAVVGGVAAAALLATLPARAETAVPAPVSSIPPVNAVAAAARGAGDPYFPTYGSRGYDARHYAIDDAYDPRSGALRGRTKLRAVASKRLPRIRLDLVLTPTAVRVDGRPAAFRHKDGRKLVITPRRALAAGQQFRVVVRYHGTPGQISRGRLSPWISGPGEGLAVGEPEICAWWFACNDHPSDKATYDITVRVPQGRQAISNGVLVSRRDNGRTTSWRWRMAEPMASYLAFFAAGRFRTQSGTAGGLPYTYAVSRGLPRSAQKQSLRLLGRTPEIVQWFAGRFGAYPFAAMGGVITRLYTGFALENQSRPVYPYLYDDAEGRSIVVHELAHQWFGDSVSVRDWRDIWLNEGFASYAEWLYDAGHGGQPVAARLTARYAQTRATSGFWRLRIGDPGARSVFAAPVYDRGAMALAALANRIGAPTLASVLRSWVAQHRYGNADIGQFVALAERVSGQDLTAFFAAWLYTGAKPAATAANGLA